MFLVFKQGQYVGLSNWLWVVIVYRVNLAVTGGSLRQIRQRASLCLVFQKMKLFFDTYVMSKIERFDENMEKTKHAAFLTSNSWRHCSSILQQAGNGPNRWRPWSSKCPWKLCFWVTEASPRTIGKIVFFAKTFCRTVPKIYWKNSEKKFLLPEKY